MRKKRGRRHENGKRREVKKQEDDGNSLLSKNLRERTGGEAM